jgi:hypothetical protein
MVDLHLLPQDWQGIVWEHTQEEYEVPARAREASRLDVAVESGVQPSAGSIAFGVDLTDKIGSPVAFLYGIPHQPLLRNSAISLCERLGFQITKHAERTKNLA